jgi:hypothetical protein
LRAALKIKIKIKIKRPAYVVGVRDESEALIFFKKKRPANVVDVRDVRAALNGLSLSPCKKRCVHPVPNSRLAICICMCVCVCVYIFQRQPLN